MRPFLIEPALEPTPAVYFTPTNVASATALVMSLVMAAVDQEPLFAADAAVMAELVASHAEEVGTYQSNIRFATTRDTTGLKHVIGRAITVQADASHAQIAAEEDEIPAVHAEGQDMLLAELVPGMVI